MLEGSALHIISRGEEEVEVLQLKQLQELSKLVTRHHYSSFCHCVSSCERYYYGLTTWQQIKELELVPPCVRRCEWVDFRFL